MKKTLSSFAKTISKGAEVTFKKSEELVSISKLTLAISTKETTIENLYTEIGQKIYKKFSKSKYQDHDIEDYIKAIDKCKKEIKDLQKEIASIKSKKLCSQCSTEVNHDAKYCTTCGAKLGK